MRKDVAATLWCVSALAIAPAAASAAAATRVSGGAEAQRSNVPGLSAARYADSFITRRGSRLIVAGRPFRFAGANAESLGLRNYGPIPSVGQRFGSELYPTRFEIDDELATLHEMGATVVRAQTLGDTIGCPLCLEPALGRFNPRAFREIDLVVAEARKFGIKLIGEFAGDANLTLPFGKPVGVSGLTQSSDWYCAWNRISSGDCQMATFEDPRVLAAYERHMKAILDHVNPYTGLAYKNDPTFFGWVDGNNLLLVNPTPIPSFETWLTKVAAYFKSIDRKQLFIDISAPAGDYLPTALSGLPGSPGSTPVSSVIHTPGVDVFGEEWYPKDFAKLDPHSAAATQIHVNAKTIAAAGRVYATLEYGWDHYNYTRVRCSGISSRALPPIRT
jgi:mannan endo-1,4-beta-mannosidase